MAKDVQDTVRDVLRAIEGVGSNGRGKSSSNGLSGVKGIAAGAGAAALVPLAVKGAGKLARGGLGDVVHAPQNMLHDATSKLGNSVGDLVSDKVEEAGGPQGILKDTVKSALPFGDDDDDEEQGGSEGAKNNAPGVGKGRRMPVQQSVDIGVNIETVYNEFTQFEDWPNFMHRVTRVTQDEPTTVKFAAKIWGKTKEFTAEIETQRPDQRIKWSVSQGMTHTGVVTFHELAPNLTRLLLTMDVEPGSLIEKAARGMRHVKRAARADLHRFKAFIEMTEQETGAWRGVIEDGEVVEDHDAEYDEGRETADLDELVGEQDQDDEDSEDGSEQEDQSDDEGEEEEEEEEEPRPRRGRAQSRAAANRSGGRSRATSSRSGSSSGGSSRSSSSRSRNGSSGGSSRSRAGASSGGRQSNRQSRSRNGQGD